MLKFFETFGQMLDLSSAHYRGAWYGLMHASATKHDNKKCSVRGIWLKSALVFDQKKLMMCKIIVLIQNYIYASPGPLTFLDRTGHFTLTNIPKEALLCDP